MPQCRVPSCKVTQRNKLKNIKFHRFPSTMKEVWLKALGEDPTKIINEFSVVCSSHFTEEDYITRGSIKRLKKDAIPSLNLTSCAKQLLFDNSSQSSTKEISLPGPMSQPFPSTSGISTSVPKSLGSRGKFLLSEPMLLSSTSGTDDSGTEQGCKRSKEATDELSSETLKIVEPKKLSKNKIIQSFYTYSQIQKGNESDTSTSSSNSSRIKFQTPFPVSLAKSVSSSDERKRKLTELFHSYSEEVPTALNHIEIKVEPNHEDLYLSEDTDPTHVMTKYKEYDFCSQQPVNVESSLSHLQDDGSTCSSNNNAQKHKNSRVAQFSKKDSNLTTTNSHCKDQPKIQRESQTKRYKCNECHKAFPRPSHLKAHSRVHTGEKPYKCTTCQKTFNQKSILITHKRVHNNERPFQCSVCSKAFTQSYNLSVHMRTHTGEKPHQCHLCQYKCTTAGALKIHIRIHTGEKPYSCKHCEKLFTEPSTLKRHERTHRTNDDSD